jgi:hypothetical protein
LVTARESAIVTPSIRSSVPAATIAPQVREVRELARIPRLLAPGPMIEVGVRRSGSGLERRMFPVVVKVISSVVADPLLLAESIAARSDPVPASSVLLTVKDAAPAGTAAHSRMSAQAPSATTTPLTHLPFVP